MASGKFVFLFLFREGGGPGPDLHLLNLLLLKNIELISWMHANPLQTPLYKRY